MKNELLILFFIFSFTFSGCGLFKSPAPAEKRSANSFTYNYEQNKVWDVLVKVLDEMRLKAVIPDPIKFELTTEKTTLSKDDIDTFQKLKEIGEVPKSPLSEYFEANYSLSISLTPRDEKTRIEIENKIQALERGRYNKWIDIKSNGAKEKDVMALLLKRLKESE